MSNTEKCHDCPVRLPRGKMHVRSQAFRQVFYCPACWSMRKRFADLTRAVHFGLAA